MIGCNSSEKKNVSEPTIKDEKTDIVSTIKELEKKLKPNYDDAIFKLETEITKRQTEVAKIPRSEGASMWSAKIEELKLERDGLVKRLDIEKNYYFDLLKAANNADVKAEIQKINGRELEKKTLETNRRLAETDRESKDLSIQIKSQRLAMERDAKLSQIENDYRIKKAQIEYNASVERLNKTRQAMNANK